MIYPDPDTLKTIVNTTNDLLPIKEYFSWYNVVCFIAGIMGIFMRVIRSVLSTSPDQSISILKYYIKNHALTLIFASLSYITVVMIWIFNGIDFFGLYVAQLNFMTIFVGYFAQDIFNEIGKRRFNINGNSNGNGNKIENKSKEVTNNNEQPPSNMGIEG